MSTQPDVVNKATGSFVFPIQLSVYKCKSGSSALIKIESLYHLIVLILCLLDEQNHCSFYMLADSGF